MSMHHILLRLLALLAATMTALSAQTATAMEKAMKSDMEVRPDTTVSIVTIYPGSDIYELEGHTVLRMRYGMQDLAVNWGVFDFDAPNFVYRFVKGETDYTMDIAPWPLLQMYYTQQGRRIVERELNLTGAEKSEILHAIGVNYLPGNRVYRYNYVKDNCATRPLAIVEGALADSIRFGRPDDLVAGSQSWREDMRRYHRNYPWYQLGIDLALGSGLDVPITERDHLFAPVALDKRLEGATTGGRNLVKSTNILNDVAEDNAMLAPTPWYLTPWAVFTLIFAAVAVITLRDWRRRKPTRRVDTVLELAVGAGGLVLSFLIFVSTHFATSPNWLYLWMNPLPLLIAVNVWIKGAEKLVFWLQIANFAMIFAAIIVWPIVGEGINTALTPLLAACMSRALLYIALYKTKRRQ